MPETEFNLPDDFPAGNYTQKYLTAIRQGSRSCRDTYLEDETSAAFVFLDVHNFTSTCAQARNRNALMDFVSIYYKNATNFLHSKNGEINKLLGDGIFAHFPDVGLACDGCMAVMEWWKSGRELFPEAFQSPDMALIGILGYLKAHPFREGLRSVYLETSWIGSELNLFFKYSKHETFSNSPNFIWFDRQAAIEASKYGLTLVSKKRTLSPARNIEAREIQPGISFFGMSLEEWKRQRGL